MPARSRRPSPPERLTELLAAAKREGLDFDDAWGDAIAQMRREKAWPHATVPRHEWQAAVFACVAEYRAAYDGEVTAYARLHVMLTTAVGFDGAVGDEIVLGALIA